MLEVRQVSVSGLSARADGENMSRQSKKTVSLTVIVLATASYFLGEWPTSVFTNTAFLPNRHRYIDNPRRDHARSIQHKRLGYKVA